MFTWCKERFFFFQTLSAELTIETVHTHMPSQIAKLERELAGHLEHVSRLEQEVQRLHDASRKVHQHPPSARVTHDTGV